MAGTNNIGVKTHFWNSGVLPIANGQTITANFGGAKIYANSVTVWNNSDSIVEVEIESTLTSIGIQIVPPYHILNASIVSDRFSSLRIKSISGTGGEILVNSMRDNKDVTSQQGKIETSLSPISSGGGSDPVAPILLTESSAALAYLDADCSKPMIVEIIRDESGVFDRYIGHLKDLSGTTIDPLSANRIGDCSEVETPIVFEQCFPFHYTLQDGESVKLSDVVILSGVIGAKGVAAFDFDLKPIDGDGKAGFRAIASQATSTGLHGNRDLDGGGSFSVKPDRLPDLKMYQLDLNQTFTASAGSVATLFISIII